MRIRIKRRTAPRRDYAQRWPIAYRWLATGVLVAYTAVGSTVVANAQTGSSAQGPAAQALSLEVRRYDIPAGTLGEALAALETASGLQFEIRKSGIRDLASPGVSGLYTLQQALQQALKGTRVVYSNAGTGVVALDLEGLNSTLEVQERVLMTSPHYTEPLRNTPQTITVIPKELIEQQGATTLRDVLRNVPGLTMTAGEGGTPAGDNLNLRGFSARNDLFVDGSRDLGPQARDPFNMEQVEVVKGPQSAFTGRGSAGGSINMVSKAPGLKPVYGGSVMFGTDGTKRFSADVNTPVRFLGERTGFRLNLLSHDGGVAGRDVVNNQRWGFAPSLAFGLGSPTRLTLSYYKLKQDNIPDYGIPWVPNTNTVLTGYLDKPAPVPRETFYGLANRDYERLSSDMATVRFEHDFSDNLSFRNQFRYGKSKRDSLATPPRFLNTTSTTINREARAWYTEDDIYDNQADVRGTATTGKVRHAYNAGFVLTHEANLRTARTVTGTSTTTLLNPNAEDPFTGVYTNSPYIGDVKGNTQAVYAFDTLKFGRKWEASGGLRWERFDVDGVNTTPAAVTRVDKMLSGRTGLVFKPGEHGSLYASYGTSMNPSLEGLTYGVANTAIQPEKTYTVEGGSKWDLFGERLSLTGAVFRVDKTNARTPGLNPDDPPQVLQGTQRVSGLESGVSGKLTRNLSLFGAYTFMDAEIVKSNTPAEVGRAIQNAPQNSFNLWASYRYKRLMFGGGPRVVGKRYGNNTNTRWVDKYWTMDAYASYAVNRHLDLRLNLNNLNNAYYYDRLGGGHVVPGAARSALVSFGIRF
ncbi:TonB-dependent siderophore receptor [Paludibaculum fermentans]|uniref:TonB-dependent siderophore receptor n=1 Tax=Paludibaculum fermentans TaxID=1473598 RepID=A0A7S7NXD6_PALFE|nr:TonB-dependent siderophore receptor [Paludibaculum fermentans]QOY91496.1 TonB-dependent siderophore receptor [Paludibaculum fermentans]